MTDRNVVDERWRKAMRRACGRPPEPTLWERISDRLEPRWSLAQMAIGYVCVFLFMLFAVGVGVGLMVGK